MGASQKTRVRKKMRTRNPGKDNLALREEKCYFRPWVQSQFQHVIYKKEKEKRMKGSAIKSLQQWESLLFFPPLPYSYA